MSIHSRATAGILSSEDQTSETKLNIAGKTQGVDDEVDLARDIVKREENLHTRSKLLVQVPPKERLPGSSSFCEEHPGPSHTAINLAS